MVFRRRAPRLEVERRVADTGVHIADRKAEVMPLGTPLCACAMRHVERAEVHWCDEMFPVHLVLALKSNDPRRRRVLETRPHLCTQTNIMACTITHIFPHARLYFAAPEKGAVRPAPLLHPTALWVATPLLHPTALWACERKVCAKSSAACTQDTKTTSLRRTRLPWCLKARTVRTLTRTPSN